MPTLPVLLGASLLLNSSCFSNDTTEFPPGFEPLEPINVAPDVPRRTDGSCEEGVVVQTTLFGRSHSAHARGCIRAPLERVYAALHVPEASWERDQVNGFMVVNPAMATECDGPYQTQINAGNAIGSVDFRVCWRFTVVQGSETNPETCAVQWQKVWGSSAISRLAGSIVATRDEANPDTTLLEIQYHLGAPETGPASVERTVRAYFEGWRAQSHLGQ